MSRFAVIAERLCWATALCVVVATGAPQPAHAFCRMTTATPTQFGEEACVEEGQPLEWRNRCLTYAIDNRGSEMSPNLTSAQIVAAVDSAFAIWQNTTCDGMPVALRVQPLEASTCREAQYNQDSGNVNTVAFTSLGDGQERALAITVVFHNQRNGEILDADILINEDAAPFAVCPSSGCPRGATPREGPADLQSIVTHEVGHFFGVGHSNIEDATMFPSTERTDIAKRSLAQDDIAAICTIYPPDSGSTECDPFPQPRGGLDLNCEDAVIPSSGGCAASDPETHHTWWFVVLALVWVRSRPRHREHAN